MITRYAPARGPNIRVDSGIEAGSFVSVFYDSLLAKVIAWGETRQEAIETLIRALNGYHIEGITTNIDFVNAILNHPAFSEGAISTRFIDAHFEKGLPKLAPPEERLHYMVMAATIVYHNRQNVIRESLKPMAAQVGSPMGPRTATLTSALRPRPLRDLPAQRPAAACWTVSVDGRSCEVMTPEFEFYRRRLMLKIDGQLPHVPLVLPIQLLRGRLLRHDPCLRGLLPQGMGTVQAHARPCVMKLRKMCCAAPCRGWSWTCASRKATASTAARTW